MAPVAIENEAPYEATPAPAKPAPLTKSFVRVKEPELDSASCNLLQSEPCAPILPVSEKADPKFTAHLPGGKVMYAPVKYQVLRLEKVVELVGKYPVTVGVIATLFCHCTLPEELVVSTCPLAPALLLLS